MPRLVAHTLATIGLGLLVTLSAAMAGEQPLGLAGAVVVLRLVGTAIFPPVIAPYGPIDASFLPYLPPGSVRLMGRDHLGRDIFSRVVWGARLSLYMGLASGGVGRVGGRPVGRADGLFRGDG
jgi:ABC-type dipeptide/oligopeptide/nickel transport system permease subunit